MVKVYPRKIDLENTARLKEFEATLVVETLDELREGIASRQRELMVNG
jgi:dihydromethanopterin reductase (acceptor)